MSRDSCERCPELRHCPRYSFPGAKPQVRDLRLSCVPYWCPKATSGFLRDPLGDRWGTARLVSSKAAEGTGIARQLRMLVASFRTQRSNSLSICGAIRGRQRPPPMPQMPDTVPSGERSSSVPASAAIRCRAPGPPPRLAKAVPRTLQWTCQGHTRREAGPSDRGQVCPSRCGNATTARP